MYLIIFFIFTDNELIFRILLGLNLVSFVSHPAYYTRKYQLDVDNGSPNPGSGPRQKIASLLAVVGLVATFLYIIKWPGLRSRWLRWLGSAIALSGFGLLQWAQKPLGENWSDRAHLGAGHQLVVSGPYQYVRHPIYASFLLILGSTVLVTANWFIGSTWIMMMVLDIRSRIEIEEQLMIARYGDQYLDYMSRTGRILPEF